MTKFDKALKFILRNEGGYVDHPDDRGGATNWGITQDTLSRSRGYQVTKDEVKTLTIEEAGDIYQRNYWNPLKCDKINSDVLATMLFDQGVNCGVSAAAKRIQNVVGAKVDGQIGPKSLEAINSRDAKAVCIEFFKETQLFYAKIVRRNKSQAVFIVGWINRSHELLDLIEK